MDGSPANAAAPAPTGRTVPMASATPTPHGWPGPDLTDPHPAHPGRRALEIAAAGRHHLALIGPDADPASLAHRLAGLLPDLGPHMSGQVADLYRRAGQIPASAPHRPPCQEPHPSLSVPALVGSPRRPGAVSLAHAGVLFADQAGRWSATAINAMVHVLDHRNVTLAPAGIVYPADLQLVLASTTCPHNTTGCDCPTVLHRRYLGRLTRLLDRINVRLPLPAPAAANQPSETTATVAARVADARASAAARWADLGSLGRTNNDASTTALKASLAGAPTTLLAPLRRLIDLGTISRRAGIGVLRLGWTIADLHRHTLPTAANVAEAIAIRSATT